MRSFLLLLLSGSVFAWENHALPTAISVSNMPEFAKISPVRSESLEAFLKSEQIRLPKILEQEERWAILEVPNYPHKPAGLLLPTKASFLEAIRVNSRMPLPLYLQELPGTQKKLPESYFLSNEVSLLPNSLTQTGHNFTKLQEGELVSPVDIFVSATDEPDYGLDIGLWSHYGFGTQPFGNPKLEFSSQAPFHMGFYHEPAITYWVAGYFAQTLPEYRIHLYYTLSRFAFETGHPYWGWRFAGWGAHYIQDLTQPYHSTLSPGESTAWMLFVGCLDLCGIHGPKAVLVQEASDKHLALEEYMYREALNVFSRTNMPLKLALEQKQTEFLRYEPHYVRDNLTLESHAFSGRLTKQDLLQLMSNFGKHTRAWVRSVILRPA